MKFLCVTWAKQESAVYYIDKDKHSTAHKTKTGFTLDSYSGTYTFDTTTKKVSLNDGTKTRNIDVIEWHTEQ